MNRRNFPRQSINTDATINTMEGIMRCQMDNISMGGLFLKIKNRMGVGEHTEINILLPNSANNGIVVDGIVIRNEDNGVAFKFHNVEYHTFCDLLDFLYIQMPFSQCH